MKTTPPPAYQILQKYIGRNLFIWHRTTRKTWSAHNFHPKRMFLPHLSENMVAETGTGPPDHQPRLRAPAASGEHVKKLILEWKIMQKIEILIWSIVVIYDHIW